MKKGARITLGIVAGLTAIGVAGVGVLSYLNLSLIHIWAEDGNDVSERLQPGRGAARDVR